ncbi:hypothetical protein BFJ70_g701 [Fusarium oxysporum]|nr:hypothetical protein FOWG_11495 [Fusarium oxysporum f. sp. lycopersici MN25]RKL51985.1 hypothetical protein BFJ70_g701 [Fusarium oxysporum]
MPQSLMSYQFGQSLRTGVFSSPHLFAANLHINPAWFRSILVFIATLTTLRHIFTTLKFSHLPRSLKIIMVSARVPDEGYVSSSMSRERIARRILDDIEGQRRGKDRAIIVVLGAKDIDDLNKRLKELEPKPEKDKSPVILIESMLLQKVILVVTEQSQIRNLTIMADETISQLSFQVPASNVQTLKIRRCGHSKNDQDKLLVDGSSEFHNRRLDEWKTVSHHGLKLHIGRDVRIHRNDEPPCTPSKAPDDNPEDPSDPVSSDQAGERDADDDSWGYIKTIISVALGTCAFFIATSTKVSGQATSGAFDFNFKELIFKGAFVTAKGAGTLSFPWCVFIGLAVGVAAYCVLSTNWFPSLKSTSISWTSSLRKWWDNTAEDGMPHGSILSRLFN